MQGKVVRKQAGNAKTNKKNIVNTARTNDEQSKVYSKYSQLCRTYTQIGSILLKFAQLCRTYTQ